MNEESVSVAARPGAMLCAWLMELRPGLLLSVGPAPTTARAVSSDRPLPRTP
jgi:hypothetical protein